jgi:hypothetical protein
VPCARQILLAKKGPRLKPEMLLDEIKKEFLVTFHNDQAGNMKEFFVAR